MSKPFTRIAIAFLSLVAILQLVRYLLEWTIVINGAALPLWASAVASALVGMLAVMTWRELGD